MQDIDTANLVYLIVLGGAVVFWFIASNRQSLGKTMQHALLWGLIFIGVLAGIGLWDDIRRTVTPMQTVVSDGVLELPRAPDGHYYLLANVNGAPIRFVVDTGASQVVLSAEDARAAGIDPDTLAYTGSASTANGIVRTASVRLDSFEVGGMRDTGVRAVVTEGELFESLLGMTYLQRFSNINIADGKLVLER
ncbi:TIGR02281 family clan AA aspartic protease [Roseovarius spongiae]|uniref:TIGR02281 family clan AA aspartic protease n=1 Tax=Roseovarius spongiae TaxID=2320272 RepID=A0A3A8AWY5_9RHOB|nr:TIGR02281 family clan AA aspartic protease [Roseovarius spongiae]RKF16938.1 TIGR02281 family clan AA aspartic protease [Roseovarius spongiae]